MTAPVLFPLAGKRVLVAGHKGMAGSSVVRRLERENCAILTADREEVDMSRQAEVEDWLAAIKPDAIFLAAAKVGGIHANSTRPAEFLYDNLIIEANVIHNAYKAGVKKLLFLGSSCIYPRGAAQPIKEEALLTGPLEPTNDAYALAKIAGIKLCETYRKQYGADFISAMPTNLYGPGDRYDLEHGHVVAALIMKIHAAKKAGNKEVVLWGTGTPLREFLYTEDLADGLVYLMKHYSGAPHVNLGTGVEHTIRQLAEAIAKAAGWEGRFVYDTTKPDGMPRKVMDVSRMTALGWTAQTRFEDGIKAAYEWYVGQRC
ncbi:GDP-L-fucose synthase [Rhizomicrobium palustre]|uniref:GDP-L-fucose synthase n=1 Tax=Rhizomicrobium palustre TaxID=189966 RepID=A0A846MUV6_9PROT|nr:GDP-L-fucose synthase [Rhizomicrobium palustre]NIK86892.1 GDP-L-fucose synthase [Rhizomicrobium palustre]